MSQWNWIIIDKWVYEINGIYGINELLGLLINGLMELLLKNESMELNYYC